MLDAFSVHMHHESYTDLSDGRRGLCTVVPSGEEALGRLGLLILHPDISDTEIGQAAACWRLTFTRSDELIMSYLHAL